MRLREMVKHKPIVSIAKELLDECMVSRERRKDNSRWFRQLYYSGSTDGNPSKNNLCFSHVDKLASYLFSPSEVRFNVSFESDETKDWEEAADLSSRYVNRNFSMRNCDLAFAQANEIGLVDGCAFIKLVWGARGYQPNVVRQQFFGVQREDTQDFDQQEAFVHSFYLTPPQFQRLIAGNRDERDIMARVAQSFTPSAPEETLDNSYFHEIVTGGLQPVGNAQSRSSVNVFGPPIPMLSPEVATKLIRVDDIWVWDDLAWPVGEYSAGSTPPGDWVTIRYVDPGIVVEGREVLRNLGDIPGEHPFVKVCPNETPGYFWGRSELAAVAFQQEWLNARLNNVDDLFALRARPPRSFIGFSGLTPEKMRALLTRGGTLTDDSPTGKIETHAPDMPPEFMAYLQMIHASFDEVGGMTSMLSGQGEPGVRAGTHANTLLKTSSPRLRDRATVVEKQCAQFGNMCFQMSRAKDARIFTTPGGKEFTLEQLPDDAMVTVDSHTSSPVFSGDATQLAFALNKAGAIDGESLIELTHPPHMDALILKFREKAKQQAQFLAQHPEIAEKAASKKR